MTKSRSHSTAVEVPPAEPAQQQDEEEAEDHSILPPDDHPLLRELAEVNNCLPGLSERLTVIDKIGEGTTEKMLLIS
jgi:hypothetical protein